MGGRQRARQGAESEGSSAEPSWRRPSGPAAPHRPQRQHRPRRRPPARPRRAPHPAAEVGGGAAEQHAQAGQGHGEVEAVAQQVLVLRRGARHCGRPKSLHGLPRAGHWRAAGGAGSRGAPQKQQLQAEAAAPRPPQPCTRRAFRRRGRPARLRPARPPPRTSRMRPEETAIQLRLATTAITSCGSHRATGRGGAAGVSRGAARRRRLRGGWQAVRSWQPASPRAGSVPTPAAPGWRQTAGTDAPPPSCRSAPACQSSEAAARRGLLLGVKSGERRRRR